MFYSVLPRSRGGKSASDAWLHRPLSQGLESATENDWIELVDVTATGEVTLESLKSAGRHRKCDITRSDTTISLSDESGACWAVSFSGLARSYIALPSLSIS